VAGLAHEFAPSLLLLKRLPEAPAWALADMACDEAEFRSTANEMDAIPVVPSRKNDRCRWRPESASKRRRMPAGSLLPALALT
jgi:hypothetical protein